MNAKSKESLIGGIIFFVYLCAVIATKQYGGNANAAAPEATAEKPAVANSSRQQKSTSEDLDAFRARLNEMNAKMAKASVESDTEDQPEPDPVVTPAATVAIPPTVTPPGESVDITSSRYYYQAAMRAGVALNYDQNSQTVTVDDGKWDVQPIDKKEAFVKAVKTLVSNGGNNVPFRIVGSPSGNILVAYPSSQGPL